MVLLPVRVGCTRLPEALNAMVRGQWRKGKPFVPRRER